MARVLAALALLAAACLACCAVVRGDDDGKGGRHHHGVLQQPVSVWNWLESTVEPDTQCREDYRNFMTSFATGSKVQGGRIYLSTAFMMLCNTTTDVGRLSALPRFMQESKQSFNATVDFLFGQAAGNRDPSGLGLWLDAALVAIRALPYDIPTPWLRFDVEYEAHEADVLRVLRQAAYVRQTINERYPQADHRPLIAWAVDFASMLDLPSSRVPCPAAGVNNATMLIGECFLHIVDHIDLMDYRSYALQQPQAGSCDGAVRFAVPFFAAARRLNRTVAVGFESNCGLGEYTYKISFCEPSLRSKFGISDALDYMYSQMQDTATFLQNTTTALQAYPCAGTAIPSLPALLPGQDYWTGVASPQPFVIEDLFGWNNMAFNHTSFAPLSCRPPVRSWESCITPEMAARSPTAHL